MRWKVFLYKILKYFSYVGFYVFAVRWVEPHYICFSLFLLSLSIFAFPLYKLCLKYNKNNTGLYRDDGLAIFKNISGPNSEKVKKDIQKLIKENELDIVFQCNMKTDI